MNLTGRASRRHARLPKTHLKYKAKALPALHIGQGGLEFLAEGLVRYLRDEVIESGHCS
jgi:hypothetical protein